MSPYFISVLIPFSFGLPKEAELFVRIAVMKVVNEVEPEMEYRAQFSPAPEIQPFFCEAEVLVSKEVKLLFFGSSLQVILSQVENETAQLFPSTETVLLDAYNEKPVPRMVMFWPPKFPVEGKIEVTVGRTANQKYQGAKEGFLRASARLANPGITFSVRLYFPATCWLDWRHLIQAQEVLEIFGWIISNRLHKSLPIWSFTTPPISLPSPRQVIRCNPQQLMLWLANPEVGQISSSWGVAELVQCTRLGELVVKQPPDVMMVTFKLQMSELDPESLVSQEMKLSVTPSAGIMQGNDPTQMKFYEGIMLWLMTFMQMNVPPRQLEQTGVIL